MENGKKRRQDDRMSACDREGCGAGVSGGREERGGGRSEG